LCDAETPPRCQRVNEKLKGYLGGCTARIGSIFCVKQRRVDGKPYHSVKKDTPAKRSTCHKSNTNKKTAVDVTEPVDNSGKPAVSNLRLFSITDSVCFATGVAGGYSFDFLLLTARIDRETCEH
jgi:hypothetical protein